MVEGLLKNTQYFHLHISQKLRLIQQKLGLMGALTGGFVEERRKNEKETKQSTRHMVFQQQKWLYADRTQQGGEKACGNAGGQNGRKS